MHIDTLMSTDRFFLTDGGLETYMIFHEGRDLPHFAAACLLDTEDGRHALRRYAERFLELARAEGRGFVLDTPTWRSGLAWGDLLGKSAAEMLDINRQAVAFMCAVRDRAEGVLPVLVNGVVGPAGDGYAPDALLTPDQAQTLHAPQITALAESGVDMISAVTLTHTGETIGIARAAKATGIPAVLSFTVETDGRLPTGETLAYAITAVDAATGASPIYYMINCAHPDHFRDELGPNAPWLHRIGGLRVNASRLSHAELDAADTLDDGDPAELAHLHQDLFNRLPNIRVVGGCCGTDHRHVGCIARHSATRTAA